MNKIKVAIVDDNEFFRNGTEVLLKSFKHYEVCGIYTNGEDFLKSLNNKETDVVLMDIKMPVIDGTKATELALKANKDLKILVLTMFGEEALLKKMIDLGVKGFVLKDINKDTFDLAIRTVHAGGQFYSEEMLKFLTKSYMSDKEDDEQLITPREMEVLALIAKGNTNQEIADELSISVRTVEGHKARLICKTSSKNIIELLLYAIRNKIINIE